MRGTGVQLMKGRIAADENLNAAPEVWVAGDVFTVWYGSEDGELVGVLTYNADEDYERGQELPARRAALSEV